MINSLLQAFIKQLKTLIPSGKGTSTVIINTRGRNLPEWRGSGQVDLTPQRRRFHLIRSLIPRVRVGKEEIFLKVRQRKE